MFCKWHFSVEQPFEGFASFVIVEPSFKWDWLMR